MPAPKLRVVVVMLWVAGAVLWWMNAALWLLQRNGVAFFWCVATAATASVMAIVQARRI